MYEQRATDLDKRVTATHTIVWKDTPRLEYEPLIQKEIECLLDRGLKCATDLFLHTFGVHNTDDLDGPVIVLSGQEGGDPDTYFAKYVGTPDWVTVKVDSDQSGN